MNIDIVEISLQSTEETRQIRPEQHPMSGYLYIFTPQSDITNA